MASKTPANPVMRERCLNFLFVALALAGFPFQACGLQAAPDSTHAAQSALSSQGAALPKVTARTDGPNVFQDSIETSGIKFQRVLPRTTYLVTQSPSCASTNLRLNCAARWVVGPCFRSVLAWPGRMFSIGNHLRISVAARKRLDADQSFEGLNVGSRTMLNVL